MKIKKIFLRAAHSLALFLSRFEPVARFSRKVADYARAENNCDMETNGEMRLVRTITPRSKVVFDVGANQGDWSREILRANPAVRLFAFEPDPATYKNLTAVLFGSNVVCENFGLGAREEEKELFVHQGGSGMNSFLHRSLFKEEDLRPEKVKLRTIDSYAEEKGISQIDFLKVDVEGFEYEVLRGAERMISAGNISAIQFEYGGTYLDAGVFLKDVFQFLDQRGYILYKIYPGENREMKVFSQDLENFQYANYLAVSRKSGYDVA